MCVEPGSDRADPRQPARQRGEEHGSATPIEVSLTTIGAEAQVRVADHGRGVPVDERALLLTLFYRSSSTRGVPGTGLGLHISQRLAERQGGRLWLDASSSAGSVFALALPVLSGTERQMPSE
jgi:signal transduction histidine kinase